RVRCHARNTPRAYRKLLLSLMPEPDLYRPLIGTSVRRLSDVVYRQMVADANNASPGGQSGASLASSAADPTPTVDSSDKPLPGLNREPTPPTTPVDVDQAPCSRQLPGSRQTRTATPTRPTAVTSTSSTTPPARGRDLRRGVDKEGSQMRALKLAG